MSYIMSVATVALMVSGVGFSCLYLWINLFASLSDLAERSKNAYKIAQVSTILSLVFALLSAVITDTADVTVAIASSQLLFSIIAIGYLVVTALCGAAMVYAVLSRSSYRRGIGAVVGKIFIVSMVGASVGLLFSWLLG